MYHSLKSEQKLRADSNEKKINLALIFLSLSCLRDIQVKMSSRSNDHSIGYINLEIKKRHWLNILIWESSAITWF